MLKLIKKEGEKKHSFFYRSIRLSYRNGIKKLRKNLDVNRADFGFLIGVTGRTIESWEHGLREPSESALMLMKGLM